MNCTICGKPVILIPSAAERARRYGGKPEDYTKLFTAHGSCIVAQREEDTLRLLKEKNRE